MQHVGRLVLRQCITEEAEEEHQVGWLIQSILAHRHIQSQKLRNLPDMHSVSVKAAHLEAVEAGTAAITDPADPDMLAVVFLR